MTHAINLTRDEALELWSAARAYKTELAKAPDTFTEPIRILDTAIDKLHEMIADGNSTQPKETDTPQP